MPDFIHKIFNEPVIAGVPHLIPTGTGLSRVHNYGRLDASHHIIPSIAAKSAHIIDPTYTSDGQGITFGIGGLNINKRTV